MNILKSVLLGIIQGMTEFLPVSSSGHLAVFKKIFGVNLESGLYFDVMLHLGTLIALIIVFHEDLWHMIQEFFQIPVIIFANIIVFFKRRKKDTGYTYFRVINSNYKKLDIMILVSCIPTGIIAIAGKGLTEKAGNTLWFVGICFMITAGLLYIADRNSENTLKIKEAGYSEPVFIGIAQGIAAMPGISRSGATISTAMMLGFNKNLAVKYSFLMSVPAVLGALAVEIKGLKGEAFGSANLPGYILGMAAAGITGYYALKYFIRLIRNKNYRGFSIYCAIMGVIALIISFIR